MPNFRKTGASTVRSSSSSSSSCAGLRESTDTSAKKTCHRNKEVETTNKTAQKCLIVTGVIVLHSACATQCVLYVFSVDIGVVCDLLRKPGLEYLAAKPASLPYSTCQCVGRCVRVPCGPTMLFSCLSARS